MQIFVIVSIFLILLLALVYILLRRKVTNHKPYSFPNAKNRLKINKNKPVVVCLGDSNTHGNVSYDWVKDLKKDLEGFQIFNAGLNSDLTFSLLRRTEEVIASQPDYISILIGTNDVNAFYSEKSQKRYMSLGKILESEEPDVFSFEQNLKLIIEKFLAETKAQIALLTLPLMGEDINSKVNILADQFSEVIERVAQDYNLGILPIRNLQKKYILEHPSKSPYHFDQYYFLLNKSVILHYIFGYSWDKISKINKIQLSPDFLHQNSVAAKMIKGEVLNWIKNDKK